MIRPAELAGIKAGEIDLAFRRWARPRVVLGTQMRTSVGLLEVTSVDRVTASALTAEDARRAGSPSVAALRKALSGRTEPVWRVGLKWAGPDPRSVLRDQVPDPAEIESIRVRLDRLDKASSWGSWTHTTLELIDAHPEVRAPELAKRVGRETADFKKDVRKLKELGLTESLDIGYRLSPRGEAVVDALLGPRVRAPRESGTPLPHVGAPATRALRAAGLTTLEALAGVPEQQVAALHGVGPFAITRLREAMAQAGVSFATG